MIVYQILFSDLFLYTVLLLSSKTVVPATVHFAETHFRMLPDWLCAMLITIQVARRLCAGTETVIHTERHVFSILVHSGYES